MPVGTTQSPGNSNNERHAQQAHAGSREGLRKLLDDRCPLTGADLDRVRLLRSTVIPMGYPIIAVHAPWSLSAHAPGKQPKASADKKPWTDPSQFARQPAELLKVTKVCANTGLAMGLPALGHEHAFFGIDIDINHHNTALHALEHMAKAAGFDEAIEQGSAPIRVRPNSGRIAVIFRAPPGVTLEILPSIATAWGKIDFLGRGRHLVIDGWHDLGMDDPVPVSCLPALTEIDPGAITVITPDQIAAAHAYILGSFPGAVAASPAGDRAAPRGGVKSPYSQEPQVPLVELLIVADALPNETVLYDPWKATGMAFFAASHGADYGLFAWTVWSRKIDALYPDLHHKNSPEGEWALMRGSPPTATGMGALIERIRRALGRPSWSIVDAD